MIKVRETLAMPDTVTAKCFRKRRLLKLHQRNLRRVFTP
jgi:hypothetical protein